MRVRRIRVRIALSLLVCPALAVPVTALAQPAPEPGMAIVDFLAGLRAAGASIIYSNELVPESLAVTATPQAADPLGQLREVLQPHGLTVEIGPRGSWLIVRGAPSASPVPGASAPFRRPPPPLESIVVSVSRYAFTRSGEATYREVDRLQLDNAPTIGEDALRTTHGLPGLTSSGVTARVNVRGGVDDESLLLLDGVRLYSPFHLKDFQSVFGGISPRLLDLVEVRTGGFPARYGDRMSGVIDMRSITPVEHRHFEIGVSTLASSLLSSGTFDDDNGAWVASARRGNLDLLLNAAGSDAGRPQYTDYFAKLSYAVNDGLTVAGSVLALDDKISLADGSEVVAGADYNDRYAWLAINHEATERLSGSYLLSLTELTAKRNGRTDDADMSIGTLNERHGLNVSRLKADWTFDRNGREQLEWGVDIARAEASYDVSTERMLPVPITVDELAMPADSTLTTLALDGRQQAAYVSIGLRATERLAVKGGLRWDAQSYLDDEQVSPRLSAQFDVGDRLSLRASWGRFFQSQGPEEIPVADGLKQLLPAQEAEHAVLGIEFRPSDSMTLRAEAYEKEITNVHPRLENLYARLSLLPELLPDRVIIAADRARARGLELSLEDEREQWRWWVNWTRALVDDRIGERWVDRSWEEPWAFKAGGIWIGTRWTASVALTVRSGWPYTELALADGALVAGPHNAQAFESFRALDLRTSRLFALPRGNFEVYGEVTNALDAENPCCIDYAVELDAQQVPQSLTLDIDNWFPTIPTIGFLWQF
jgi:outer membrane receptor protein involved in Fe transport